MIRVKNVRLKLICQLEHGNLPTIQPILGKCCQISKGFKVNTLTTYAIVVKKLEEGDAISLLDMAQLPYQELDMLFENIKFWKVYGNNKSKLIELPLNHIKSDVYK